MSTALLVEIAATSPAGETATLRFTDQAIAPLPPSDPDRPNADYDDRLVTAPTIQRQLWSSMTDLAPTFGVGTMTLANADRGLDAWKGHTWGAITVYEWTPGTAFSEAAVLIAGVCAPPAYTSGGQAAQVQVGLYDYRVEASKPLQSTLYAGTNGTGGVLYEGAADGLKGTPKPLAWGNLEGAQVAAPQVNAGAMVYQLHDGAISGAEQLFDRGDAAGYAADGDFAGAAFDGHAPAAAHYCTDRSRGLVKLNGAPVGELTFGFKGDAGGAGYVETPGPVLARILAKAGVPAERIGASVAALASAAVVGIWSDDSSTAQDLMTPIAASALAAVLPDRAGVWQAIAFGPPAEAADLTLSYDQVINVQPDGSAPSPVGEVRVGWGRIWTTFSGANIAPALKGTDSEEQLATEYRWATVENAAVKARYPGGNWPVIELETALRGEADAQALAQALADLFGLAADGAPRQQWQVTVERDVAAGVELGKTIALDYPSQGISGRFLLTGEQLMRPRRNQAIWTVWG